MRMENVGEKILKSTLKKVDIDYEKESDQKIEDEVLCIKKHLSPKEEIDSREKKQREKALNNAIKKTVSEYQKNYPELTIEKVRVWIFSDQINEELSSLKTTEGFKKYENLKREDWKKIQKILKMFGHDLGDFGKKNDGIDGLEGKITKTAVKNLQKMLIKNGCFDEMKKPNAGNFDDGLCGDRTLLALVQLIKKSSLIQEKTKEYKPEMRKESEFLSPFPITITSLDQSRKEDPSLALTSLGTVALAPVVMRSKNFGIETKSMLEQEIGQLETSVEKLTEKLSREMAKRTQLQKKFKELSTKKTMDFEKTSQINAQLEQVNKKIIENKKALQEAKSQIKNESEARLKAEKLLENSQTTIKEIQKDLATEKVKTTQLKETLKTTKEQFLREMELNKSLRERISIGGSEVEILKQKLYKSNQSLLEKEVELKNLQEKLVGESAAKTSAQNSLREAQHTIETIKKELRLTKKGIRKAKLELKEARSQTRKAQAKLKNIAAKKNVSLKKIQELQQRLELTEQNLREQITEKQNLVKENTRLVGENQKIKALQKEISKSQKVSEKVSRTNAKIQETTTVDLSSPKEAFSSTEKTFLEKNGIKTETITQLEKIAKANPKTMEMLKKSLANPKELKLFKTNPDILEVLLKAEKYAKYKKYVQEFAKYGGILYGCSVVYGYNKTPDDKKYDFIVKTTADFGGFIGGVKTVERLGGNKIINPFLKLGVDLLGGFAGAVGAGKIYKEVGEPALNKYFPNRNQNMTGWNNGKKIFDVISFASGGALFDSIDYALEKTGKTGQLGFEEDSLDYLEKTVSMWTQNLEKPDLENYLVRDLSRLKKEARKSFKILRSQEEEIRAVKKNASVLDFPKAFRDDYEQAIKPLIEQDKESKSWFEKLNYKVSPEIKKQAKEIVLKKISDEMKRLKSIQDDSWIGSKKTELAKTELSLMIIANKFKDKLDKNSNFIDTLLKRVEKKEALVENDKEDKIWQKLIKSEINLEGNKISFPDFLSLYGMNHKKQIQLQEIEEFGNLQGQRL